MLLSSAIVEFYLFYGVAVDEQMWALLKSSQGRVSDAKVTFKASGSPVNEI